ncbi:MAG: hypothetical protein V4658_11255 [Bacteroidota bacterium]
MKMLVVLIPILCCAVLQAQVKPFSLNSGRATWADHFFNNLYFGNNTDMIVYRNKLVMPKEPVAYGYVRLKMTLSRQTCLLFHTEYMHTNGFSATTRIGMRKLF